MLNTFTKIVLPKWSTKSASAACCDVSKLY